MALDFPASPITGQTYTGPGGIIWAWDGVKWVNGTQIGTAYAPIASPLFTGDPRSTTTPPPGDADTSLATTAFVAAAVAPAGNNAGRNLIHNPGFTVAQRGAGPFTTAFGYTLDRWLTTANLDTYSFTQGSLTDANRTTIGDESATAQLLNTFTGNAGAAAVTAITQYIEGVRRLAGKTVTVSFWAACTSGTLRFGCSLDQNFGTGGSPSAAVLGNGQSVTLTTTWTRYSLTFALPSSSGKTLGTNGNDQTALNLWYSAGTTYATRSGSVGVQAGTVGLWGVQVEVGTQATPLDYGGSPADQLRQCQRFYWVFFTGAQAYTAQAGGVSGWPLSWPVSMRASPTVTFSNQTTNNVAAIVAYNAQPGGFELGVQATAAGMFSASFTITASADL